MIFFIKTGLSELNFVPVKLNGSKKRDPYVKPEINYKMKTKPINILIRNLVPVLFATLIFSSFDAFAKKFEFLVSANNPAAIGYVNVSKDKNNNYVIELEVSNLAPVERLQPARKAYVIWMVTGTESKNLGQLISGTKYLSSKLKAHFETTTAVKPVRIFITAESDPATTTPDDKVTLTTTNINVK